jgi:hypothetical protein
VDQITQLLQALAAQLGVTTEYLWPYLVRYTFAQSLSLTIVNLIGAAIAALFVYLSIKVLRSGWGRDMGIGGPSAAFFQVAGGFIGMVLFFVFGMVCLNDASHHVAGIFVPEAQAIFDILDKLTPKK